MIRSVLEGDARATALWLLAGFDPSGGAGLARDVATVRACAPALPFARLVTAWTRQGHGHPAVASPRPRADLLRELAAMPPARAVKVGLLPAPLVSTILAAVRDTAAPVVLDPVLAASDGGDLGARAEVLVDVLKDMAQETWIVTPNRAEALALLRAAEPGTDPDLPGPELAARLAARLGRAAVVLKSAGGDDPDRVCDVVWLSGQVHTLDRARIPGPDPRGTGCALATAIACGLALGRTPLAAITDAVRWLDAARTRCTPGPDGRPHLPTDAPPLP